MKEALVFGRLDDDDLQKRLRTPRPAKTIRVFLSSTFTDTAEERNRILKFVVPKLQESFAPFGYEFQASEMRWSIGEEESANMETSGICMVELTNCQASSAGINYLYLACDKYGFRPPPKTVPQDVFEKLLALVPEESAAFVRKCYTLDTNSAVVPEKFKPPLPACGPSRETREKWDAKDGPQYVLRIGTDPWEDFEKLVTTLRTAALQLWGKEHSDRVHRNPALSHWLKKFVISVTEEELCHGALWANPEEGRTRIKVFKRSFEEGTGKYHGIPLGDKKAKNFVDMKSTEVDEEAQELLKEQKAMRSPDREWTIRWAPEKGVDPNDPDHEAYLRDLCAQFEAVCIESLNEALASEEKPDAVVDEAERHLRFADARARKFHKTQTAVSVLHNVSKYLQPGCSDGMAFVVWGKSGAGKTYIMSEAARGAAQDATAKGGACVVRFLGTTAASSKVALLLESVVEQLKCVYGKNEVEIPSDFRELEALFKEAVMTWPSVEKPLTLILDSVDQLDDSNAGRLLQWLPTRDLPDCVRVLVSSLPDYPDSSGKKGFDCLSRLRRVLENDASFSKVEDIQDPKEVILHLLSLQGRTITDQQMEAVLKAFRARSENDMAGTPLWLTLVAQWAASWHSYDEPPQDIPASVRGLILQLFEHLVKLRGKALVRKTLAVITLCKDGISEVELAHVLSLDDDVLAEAYKVIRIAT